VWILEKVKMLENLGGLLITPIRQSPYVIYHSVILAALVKTGKVSLEKRKLFPNSHPGYVPSDDIDDAITPAEENEIPFPESVAEIGLVYTVGTPGTDVDVTSEQGVREAITNQTGVETILFDTTYTEVTHLEGKMHWHTEDGTLELGMMGDEVNLQVGQESLIYVRNDSGSDIPNGTVVYINSAQGNSSRPTIALCDSTDSNTWLVEGMTTEAIADGTLGYITTEGKVRGVDTSGYTAGDTLYLSTTGTISNSHPSTATGATVIIGTSVNSKLDGTILFHPHMFSLGNDFNGTLRNSIKNKSMGVSAAVGFTAINDLDHFTTMGIACSGNTVFPNETSVYYAPGYGDHWQAIDGAKDFVWFSDPEDRHANGALEYERMRLTSDGDLYLKNKLYLGDNQESSIYWENDQLNINFSNPSVEEILEVFGNVVYRRQYATPDSITIIDGTTTSSLSDLSIFGDGNTFVFTEVATGAGQQYIFNFNNISQFSHILFRGYYAGAVNTHEIDIQLYNCQLDVYDTVRTLKKGTIEDDMEVMYFVIPYDSINFYIDNSNPSQGGRTKIRFLHVGGAVNGHTSHIDFIGLEI